MVDFISGKFYTPMKVVVSILVTSGAVPFHNLFFLVLPLFFYSRNE